MSRFYTTAVNGRGNTIGIGGQQSAGEVHLRGWDAGVRVVPIGIKGEPDRFEIYMTGGSHNSSPPKLLGQVRMTDYGPLFFPNAMEYSNGKTYRFDGSN